MRILFANILATFALFFCSLLYLFLQISHIYWVTAVGIVCAESYEDTNDSTIYHTKKNPYSLQREINMQK